MINVIKTANDLKLNTISLTGKNGGSISNEATIALKVPSSETAIIQECHLFIEHLLCSLVEYNLGFNQNGNS